MSNSDGSVVWFHTVYAWVSLKADIQASPKFWMQFSSPAKVLLSQTVTKPNSTNDLLEPTALRSVLPVLSR